MAISCQNIGTNVGFTAGTDESSLCSSSSGGGLFFWASHDPRGSRGAS